MNGNVKLGGVRRLAVANGPNIFQMLLVGTSVLSGTISLIVVNGLKLVVGQLLNANVRNFYVAHKEQLLSSHGATKRLGLNV